MTISCKSRTQISWCHAIAFTERRADHIHRYDFEYEDDDEEGPTDVNIENKYYNAKQLKATDPKEAIDEFLGVPSLEPEKGDWYGGLAPWSRGEREREREQFAHGSVVQGIQGVETNHETGIRPQTL